MRTLLTLIILVLTAAPAAALDLRKARWVFDQDCTDSYDTPATTVNVDLTTSTNWDSQAEAVDPDLNLDDADQTTGSPDGWCDTAPYRIASSLIPVTTSEQFWVGPIQVDPAGFYASFDFDASGTNFNLIIMHENFTSATDAVGAIGTQTLFSRTLSKLGPYTESSSSVISTDQFEFPRGTQLYLRMDVTGTTSWSWEGGFYPVMSHYDKSFN